MTIVSRVSFAPLICPNPTVPTTESRSVYVAVSPGSSKHFAQSDIASADCFPSYISYSRDTSHAFCFCGLAKAAKA